MNEAILADIMLLIKEFDANKTRIKTEYPSLYYMLLAVKDDCAEIEKAMNKMEK